MNADDSVHNQMFRVYSDDQCIIKYTDLTALISTMHCNPLHMQNK